MSERRSRTTSQPPKVNLGHPAPQLRTLGLKLGQHPPVRVLDALVLLYYCTSTGGNVMSYGYGAGGLIVLILLVLLLTGRL